MVDTADQVFQTAVDGPSFDLGLGTVPASCQGGPSAAAYLDGTHVAYLGVLPFTCLDEFPSAFLGDHPFAYQDVLLASCLGVLPSVGSLEPVPCVAVACLLGPSSVLGSTGLHTSASSWHRRSCPLVVPCSAAFAVDRPSCRRSYPEERHRLASTELAFLWRLDH